MKPEQNQRLAELAVRETGLGNVSDKIKKNHNKTLGLLRDIKSVKSFGHVSEDKEKGLSTYLRPKGVVAAIVPSTNPLATPVNNIINALKCGNSLITALMVATYMYKGLLKSKGVLATSSSSVT